MKEIVFEYEKLVIIAVEGCLTAVYLDELSPKVYHINLFDWLPPTNDDIIIGIKAVLEEQSKDILEEYIQAYKEDEMYENVEQYHNEMGEY
jgi:hypothetical protein